MKDVLMLYCRLIEVNGKIVLNKTRDDLMRLLAAAPDPAQVVILRKSSQDGTVAPLNNASKEVSALRSELEVIKERAEEAQKAKEGLRSDNIRLTHRISYLEEQVSDLLSHKSTEDIRVVTPSPVISTVKSNQNVTNINITTQNPHHGTPSVNSDMRNFQKNSHSNTYVASESKESSLPVRSRSSLSNVSNVHIPAPIQNGDYHCHKNQYRHKHRSSRNGFQYPPNGQVLDNSDKITYRKHNHQHSDYNSETNLAQMSRYNKKKHETHRYSSEFAKTNSEKEYSGDIMDQSYKKATKIVHELTRNRDTSLKSTSVLDFRSEIHIGPKYSDSKSVEDLDVVDSGENIGRSYKNYHDSRSVKSLDFDSDCNSVTTSCRGNTQKIVDYTSEPTNDNRKLSSYPNYYDNNAKPRPTPPKKPVRLSLHKTHSLQSVDTNSDSQSKGERKSLKRTYKGQIPVNNIKFNEQFSDMNGHKIMWNGRNGMENNLENNTWC
ncbi:hypothetical protein NQ318_011822 [Aromia moschata]|uniref:Uncharacterized protein n=1 Tax=Aromia moschata TaxID=1265417 RepID=A0AAV8XRY0_9CUCU|nr:hypothetical protein NQ318_011822 [Aromia moschata]